MTKISIITINFNNAKGLDKTMKSVLSQNFNDYEYIVIDGNSTDESLSVIKAFSDKITYWVSEPDSGVYNAMNKGIAVAKGQYLHFLNSGDYYAADTVLSNIFSKSYSEPFIRGIQICDYGNHQILWTNLGNRNVTLYDMFINTMLHQATFIRHDMFEKYGMYDENLKIVSDWKFFFKSVLGGEKTTFVNQEIVVFEMNGISTDRKHGEQHLKERRAVLKELMPPNILKDYERLKQLENNAYISELILSNKLYRLIFKIMNRVNKLFRKSV